jgi:hypothetical protein
MLLKMCMLLVGASVVKQVMTMLPQNMMQKEKSHRPGDFDDEPRSLIFDAKGNVYFTGGSGGDFATIKYNANGNQLWVKRYIPKGRARATDYRCCRKRLCNRGWKLKLMTILTMPQ